MADVHARRRRNALACVAGLSLLTGVAIGATRGDDQQKALAKPIELPGGGRTIIPGRKVVAFYGLPGDDNLGVLGVGSPASMSKKLVVQARPYNTRRRPVLPAMELISTLARDVPTETGNYASRTPHRTIHRYLRAARRAHALLILDIQPGRGSFNPEIDYIARWLKEPDVGLALDPEWHVGPQEIPGQVIGSMNAETINAASAYLTALVRRHKLPQKLLLVHRFTPGMIKDNRTVRRTPGVALAINVDGFGTPAQKTAKYKELARLNPRQAHGFKLFYEEDIRTGTGLMTPTQVQRLKPLPSVVVYE